MDRSALLVLLHLAEPPLEPYRKVVASQSELENTRRTIRHGSVHGIGCLRTAGVSDLDRILVWKPECTEQYLERFPHGNRV